VSAARAAVAVPILLAFALPAAAQESTVGGASAALRVEARESFTPSVRVSGATRVGVMSGDPMAPVTPGQFAVLVPGSATAGTLCIRILSADGQYEARISQALPPDSARGSRVLRFNTSYPEALQGRRASDLAIEATLASPGATCDGRDGRVLVASWEPTVSDRDFWVVVNSGQLRTELTARIGASTRTFACEPVAAARKVAFDQRCRVTLAANERAADLRIVRRRLGNILTPIPVPMSWP
jgi:hypothetical protein